ncbi:MAG: hypothetical protein OXG60_04200 [Chloroflexi bacterium]|nr:hypothetical protein [Chloroflexota bacterium]
MQSDQNLSVNPQNEEAAEPAIPVDEIEKLARQIGEKLGEKGGKPIRQIAQMIEKCGWVFVEKILAETEATEAAGGLLTQDKKRRRSKGGVFFFLAKGQMDPELRARIFPNFGKHGDGAIMPPGIDWGERAAHMAALREQPGQINNLTVTLIGRPGALRIEGSSVMTVIEQREVKAPPYPKGVPPFDAVRDVTKYYVFMGLRHWRKVEKPLENEEDMLIVEGSAVYDPQLGGITVLSTGVSTKALESQKRQKGSQAGTKSGEQAARGSTGGKSTKSPAAIAEPPDLSGLPEESADKLRQLFSAAEKLRHKIDTMEDKGQKSGLAMTRRLLEQTEKQIASLVKQYNLV